MSALILLASYTPHFVPFEFSIIVSKWNKRSHVSEDLDTPLSDCISPSVPPCSDVESPAQYLLSLYSQFYTLSDQVFTSNAGYLSRVLGDLGLNRYLICWVAFEWLFLMSRPLPSSLKRHTRMEIGRRRVGCSRR